jgi:RNA polymerase subunit RPABC4/transcription elongation factor Spt4
MALVVCPECKKEMSDRANACPSCGHKKSIGFGTVVILVTLIFFVAKCSSVDEKTTIQKPVEKTPEQRISEIKFNRDVKMLRAFKSTIYNPASLKIDSVIRVAEDTLCVQYRATNKLNAVVLGQIAILNDGKIENFNANCAGKPGENITNIRMAL